ncbi:MAG TPA: alpha/beta hydrolase [Kofleriaceae bacterium]|nr:alpha/beta hydrolase [Kofleriaceae bacterium]
MHRLGKTPAFRGPHGDIVDGSIAEIRYLRLGGVEQWVMIRGEAITNPPLVLLHGGPGLSETGWWRYFNGVLEKHFTVVYWDQRGAGKSFDPDLPRSSMTVDQFVADLDELVEYVRRRVGARKVTIYGHSWGSAIGVLYTARYPDKVAAYVGSGQYGDARAADLASYRYALAEAHRQGRRKALAELVALGPPPFDTDRLMRERMWVQRLDGQLKPRVLWKYTRAALAGSESSIFELPATYRGFRWSLDALWAEASALDLRVRAPRLEVPVFFFLGRKDRWVPPETSVAYFELLSAPSKQIVWFEESAHEPFVDEADKFNASMIELVRPVAAARSAA